MNMKKTKIALALGALLFLAAPLSSVFADEKRDAMKDMQMECSIQDIKNELRSYVEGVKSNDTQKMQLHVNKLLTLSDLPEMDHSTMEYSTMDHSEMPMNHADMANETMPAMDHSTMDHSEMGMNMGEHDMSTMGGMSHEAHQHMMCMQGVDALNDLFKQLSDTQDKTTIKLVLGKIKEQIQKIH